MALVQEIETLIDYFRQQYLRAYLPQLKNKILDFWLVGVSCQAYLS